ncbi:MAG TPA: hypothetical protein VHH12_14500, partial [Mycobacterium sp.]|nr:hypothetical protein [Mycobacterium sp.]
MSARCATAYRFLTVWRVTGTVAEVKSVLSDSAALPRWWPSVYLSVRPVHAGAAGGVGAVVDVHTKGWLPYTLRWMLRITEPIGDAGFALEATGDLCGTGRWTFLQEGPQVRITFDWQVVATKPLLRRLGWIAKPVFAANHRWAMARGEKSLDLELHRRRAFGCAGSAAGATRDPGSSRRAPSPSGGSPRTLALRSTR